MIEFALYLSLAGLAAPAIAQDAPPTPRGGGMMRADANGDGVVTRAEALAQAGERFDRMDANGDGQLTADEIAQIGERMRGRRPGRTGDAPPPPPVGAVPPQ